MKTRATLSILAGCGATLVCAAVVWSGDGAGSAEDESSWLQWGGAGRDFKLSDQRLATSWPAEGPPEVWRRELGDGNSGVAVVNEHLYTMYRRDDDEIVVALDRSSGRTLWESSVTQSTWDGFHPEYGFGPHTTPLVVGDRVLTIGIGGRIRCLDRHDGSEVWRRELWDGFDLSDYEFGPAQLGYSASPLLYGDTVIAVGGDGGRSVFALDAATGDTVWTAQDFPPGFASPILIDFEGETQLVVFAADRVAGLDPGSGELLWEHPHETPYMVNAATPIWGEDNLLFISSAYDTGSRTLRLSRSGKGTVASEVWFERSIEVHHQTAVRLGDVIHASSGDFGPAFLTGVDARTGEQIYKMRGFAKANYLAVGGRLLILDEGGVLALLEVGEGEPRVLARSQILHTRSWTVPTLVDGILYARDREEIVALDLRASP